MKGLEKRLKRAIAELRQSDTALAQELDAVRARPVPEAVDELGPALESLGGGAGDMSDLALETIVLRTGRPVLTVNNDEAVLEFNDTESEVWRSRLLAGRDKIRQATRSVGRIELENHPLDWVGTGWLVAPDVVVTNRHVATEFATRRGERFVFKQSVVGQMSARIDFLEELGRDESREFELESILHVESEAGPDLAFLRVEQRNGNQAGDPIVLSPRPAVPNEQVVVIGYPARDGRIPEQQLMFQIFGNVFDKKRLAPGQIKRLQRELVLHDCSTLGGCSGAVVLGIDSGEALALHFSGRFLEANYAVAAQVVARRLRDYGRNETRSKTSVAASGPQLPADGSASRPASASLTVTLPLRIQLEVGVPEVSPSPVAAAPRLRSRANAVHDASDGDEADEIVIEGRVEDYDDRDGYQVDFLGQDVPLPEIHDSHDLLSFRVGGERLRELKYEHSAC